jgi:hypothetical protein
MAKQLDYPSDYKSLTGNLDLKIVLTTAAGEFQKSTLHRVLLVTSGGILEAAGRV